ncbi:UNVERIFIED_CONTAM: hypothetical protein HDU68_004566 [Siphonaria sp. JEL0065]|nr:hypothetical protein HDU68_004566 [Siphonaria sp. JEL0065]
MPPPPVMPMTTLLTILLYIYAAGMVLNGTIIFAAGFDSKRLLKTSMDKLTVGLVFMCFTWSAGRALIHSLQGLGHMSLTNPGAAAFSNICIVTIFCLNVHLAMERYFQIREHKYANLLYTALYMCVNACVGAVVWMFSTSPTSDGIKPDLEPQRTGWVVVASFVYGMTIFLMGWFYTRTYRYSSRQFDENPALATFFMSERDGTKDDPEILGLVRVRVEREILTKCLLLSLSLVICYAPFFSYQIQSYTVGLIPTFDLTMLYYDIAVILLSADVVITPMLVFFFKKEVRDAIMFWK